MKKNALLKCIKELKTKRDDLKQDLEEQKKEFKSLAEASLKKGLHPEYFTSAMAHFDQPDDLSMSFFDQVLLDDPKKAEKRKEKDLDGRKMNYL